MVVDDDRRVMLSRSAPSPPSRRNLATRSPGVPGVWRERRSARLLVTEMPEKMLLRPGDDNGVNDSHDRCKPWHRTARSPQDAGRAARSASDRGGARRTAGTAPDHRRPRRPGIAAYR